MKNNRIPPSWLLAICLLGAFGFRAEAAIKRYIRISSNPAGAKVFLNGVATSYTTPIYKFEIRWERNAVHTLRVEKDGYEPQERSITYKQASDFYRYSSAAK